MTVLTEGRHAAEFVMSEAQGMRSRGTVTIAESQTITPGTLLARTAVAANVTATAAADAGNTGDGAITMGDPAVAATVRDGVYTAVCIEEGSDVGTFRVEGPDGAVIGTAVVDVEFDGEVVFTIADGSTDFAAGDIFRITVAANADAYQYVAHDMDATDGTEVPVAIALYSATTEAAETADIAAIVRDAEVNSEVLEWDTSITAAAKANAKQALAARGIIVR